ncbi:MAG: hypothetical protein QNJ61_07560, partial [Desulfobacterales bacterium]|nr:hypothetical protein [Desulfobacterales bacterium]
MGAEWLTIREGNRDIPILDLGRLAVPHEEQRHFFPAAFEFFYPFNFFGPDDPAYPDPFDLDLIT